MVLDNARKCYEIIMRDVGPPEGIAVRRDNRHRIQVLHDQNPSVLVPDSEDHWQAEGQNKRPRREEVVVDADEEGSQQSVHREEKLVHAVTL